MSKAKHRKKYERVKEFVFKLKVPFISFLTYHPAPWAPLLQLEEGN